MWIQDTKPVTLFNSFLSFRDTGKKFERKGDLFKMTTNKNYNVDLACLADKGLMHDFEKELFSDVKATGNKSSRDRSLINLIKSPSLMIFASDVSSSDKKKFFSNTIFISSDPKELCGRLKF